MEEWAETSVFAVDGMQRCLLLYRMTFVAYNTTHGRAPRIVVREQVI